MYLNILKKDLKRKRAMNVILLVFIILASMFVSSSVNNIITVVTAIDGYFEKAGVPDYFVTTREFPNTPSLSDKLESIEAVENYKTENIIFGNPENFFKGEEQIDTKNTSIIMSFDDAATKYFDNDGKIITGVEKGTVLLSNKTMINCNLNHGDEIEIRFENTSLFLTIAGGCKDAVLGSDLMGMTRFILHPDDYKVFESNTDLKATFSGCLYYIATNDVKSVEKSLSEENNILFNADYNTFKLTYVMDMIIAAVLLVVSVCLITIAFVVLKFTITFTLSEEFREIGVMKAIGIKNVKIRGLYMVKYFSLAVIGATIGFTGSIPFANMLLDTVSKSILLENDSTILINLICSTLVVAIILLFCFGCTGKVKKLTPIDAIRNGTTGERFKKKSFMKLNNTPVKPSLFMALNDVLSSPKRYLSIILTFMMCLLLVLILANTANTLKSDKLVVAFGSYQSDVFISLDNDEFMKYLTTDGREKFENKLNEIENKLAENGMPCDCTIETVYKYNLSHGDSTFRSITLQGIDTTTDMYTYYQGTAPANENEIAITPLIAEKLNVEIGDTITINHTFGDREYIITALYQSMNNLGEGVRLHENAETDFGQCSGFFAIQIEFDDSPDKNIIRERVEKIKKIYDTAIVMTAGEYVETMVGVASTIDAVKMMTLAITVIITILITVLMERSFIAKEKGEIATLKAMGFRTFAIMKWHTLRFAIVGIIATVIGTAISTPVTALAINPVFNMMGAFYGVNYEINPVEVFIIYPTIILVVTVLSTFITSTYTKTIKANEASSID